MTEGEIVNVIRGQVDLRAALDIAERMAAGIPVVTEQSVLYPYFAFAAHCRIPTIAGSKSVRVNCLVDGVNGSGATADAFATECVIPGDEARLQPEIAGDDARRIAQRTITHTLGKKLKMIAPFDVRLEPAGTVYKRFWIMRVGQVRIMMDGVTGRMHPLTASAA